MLSPLCGDYPGKKVSLYHNGYLLNAEQTQQGMNDGHYGSMALSLTASDFLSGFKKLCKRTLDFFFNLRQKRFLTGRKIE